MTLMDASRFFAALADQCTDEQVGAAIEAECKAILPALEAVTPVRTGAMRDAWRVEDGADVRGRVITNRVEARGTYYAGLVRAKGARVLPQGHPPSVPGWHWSEPPVYIHLTGPIIEQLRRRLDARVRNVTAPYIPVLEEY